MSDTELNEVDETAVEDEARRNFLKSAGKFAAVTPPAITFLLGTSLGSAAIAASSGAKPRGKWHRKHKHGKRGKRGSGRKHHWH